MPMSCAAADWVKSRSRMMRSIFTTSPALIKCSPAPARPRSANTLPELGSSLRAFLFGILYLTAQLFEPLPDYFYLGFRCRDTSDADGAARRFALDSRGRLLRDQNSMPRSTR